MPTCASGMCLGRNLILSTVLKDKPSISFQFIFTKAFSCLQFGSNFLSLWVAVEVIKVNRRFHRGTVCGNSELKLSWWSVAKKIS
jgi:hypothetical protein